MPPISRRSLLGAALAGGAALATAIPASAATPSQIAAASGVDPALLGRAMAALDEHTHSFWSTDLIAIADFTDASATPRFHLVDFVAGRTTTLLVAHGLGSDPANSGFLHAFSNLPGSNATSEGAYLTDEPYTGMHGLSLRLNGLDQTNSNARMRDIVAHAASYVSRTKIESEGKIGRSNGCFAFAECDIAQVLARLGRGKLLYAGRSTNSRS
jgi:hypothetical protein